MVTMMSGSWWDVLLLPMVGIAFLAALPWIIGGASAAGSIAQGMASGRNQTNQNQAQLDALRSNQYQTAQNAMLDAGKLALQAPQYRMQNMVRASMLANAQPMSISHPRATIPQMSGGFNPAQLLSPSARQMGNVVQRQALLEQMQGDNMNRYLLQAPGVTPMKSAGWLENLLGAAGMAGGLAGGAYYGGKNIQSLYGNGGVVPTTPLPETPISGMPSPGINYLEQYPTTKRPYYG